MTKTTTNKTNTKLEPSCGQTTCDPSCGICNPAFPNLGICNPAFTFIHPRSSVKSVDKLRIFNPTFTFAFKFLTAILLFATTISCTAYKKVPYLTDAQTDTIYQSPALQEPVVQPGDQLTITVLPGNIADQDNVKAFNLPLAQTSNIAEPTKAQTWGSTQQTYQVSPDGTIQFPQLGTIKIGGLTRDRLETHIKSLISPAYVKDPPIVTSRFVNYTISVLGEVQNPGVFKIDNATINIFQALALAGDMTLYGERNNVKLMRFDRNGEKNMIILDLQDAKLLASPFFELRQNDVLYVEANKSKSNTRDLTGIEGMVFSSISSVLNAAGIVVKSVKK